MPQSTVNLQKEVDTQRMKNKEDWKMESYTVECRTQEGDKVTIYNVLATSEKNAAETVRRGFPNLIVGSAVKIEVNRK